jgi:predicted nucleic acid-binding protein
MLLLDTMVVSETAKLRPDPRVRAWLDVTDPALFHVSVITLGEIAAGIEKKRLSDPLFSARLDRWADNLREDFRDRTFFITTEIALRWGRLFVLLKRRDMDLLIAATALEHGLTVVTRNTRHFEPTGAKLLNPYET